MYKSYIKVCTSLGCSLKDIFSEINVVCGNNTVRRWKMKFDSAKNAQNEAVQSVRSQKKMWIKPKKSL